MSSIGLREMLTDIANRTNDEWTPNKSSPLLDAIDATIACLTVLGNGMVFTVMLLRRRVFSSFTNRLILHQSITDAIAGVLLFLHHVVIKTQNISLSIESAISDQFLCRLVYSSFLLRCANVASTYNLVMISLERFMATCHPVKHRNTLSKTKLKIVVFTVWMVGCIENVPLLVFIEPHQGSCQIRDLQLGKLCLFAVPIAIEYFVPLTVMIFSYTRILVMLTKKLANPVNAVINKAKKNLISTTLTISIMFVLCWTPAQIGHFRHLICDRQGNILLYQVSASFVACNMLVNPIIYCLKYQHFRSQLKDLVLTRFRRNRVHIGEPAIMLRPR